MKQSNELEMLNYELVYKFKQTSDGNIMRFVEWWNVSGAQPVLVKTVVSIIRNKINALVDVNCKRYGLKPLKKKHRQFREALIESYVASQFCCKPINEEK